jgi:teichuronic acid biosynthesis glycosyltransferase TuaG
MALVTIILPVYNAESTIVSTLKSILRQSFNDFELLIYNDCSTDQTESLILSEIEQYDNIKYFVGETNIGPGAARNFLLNKVQTEVIAFIDADDMWAPAKLELQLAAMKQYSYDIVTCAYEITGPSGNLIGHRSPPRIINFWSLHLSNWLPTSMTIIKSSLKHASQMPDMRKRQDYAYWLRIFRDNKNIKCGIIKSNLGTYTRQPGSVSASKIQNLQYNFYVFHSFMGYTRIAACCFVLVNIFIRLFRT